MKTKVFFTLFLLFAITVYSQKQTYDEPQWKIRLFFEDATGAKDTLTVGYDPTASIYLDEYEPQFGEVFKQVDTTKFNVYTRKFGQYSSPAYPPINTNMLMKTTITSWYKPYTKIGWVHGQFPITITWEEPKLDSSHLPAIFEDLETYPRARIDMWFSPLPLYDITEPACVNWTGHPTPPTIILSGDISYNWPMAGCKFSDELVFDSDETNDVSLAIPVIDFRIIPYLLNYWDSSSVDDLLDKSFTVYPNPLTDTLFIDNTNNLTIRSVAIYSIFGQLVLTKDDDFHKTDIAHLSQGIYLVKIATEHGNVTKKIIKQ